LLDKHLKKFLDIWRKTSSAFTAQHSRYYKMEAALIQKAAGGEFKVQLFYNKTLI